MTSGDSAGAEHTADDCLGVEASPSPSGLGPATPSKPGSCTAQDGSCELHRLRRPLRVAAGASLAERAPEVAAWLDVELSGFSAAQISVGSSTVLGVWRCDKGHTWCAPPNTLTNATHPSECGICAGKVVIPSTSLAAAAPWLVKQWDVEANDGMTAWRVAPNDNRLYSWICPVAPDHRWKASPNNRYSKGKGSRCPMCSGQKASSTNNLTLSPDLSLRREWDFERNAPLTPVDVTIGSKRKVWWACPRADDHRWEASVGHRRGCPCCAGHQLSSTNRLSVLRPDLATELDETRSEIAAHDLSVGSNKRVWWNCLANTRPKHEPWRATVLNRTGGFKGRGTSCPDCQLVGTSEQELRLKAELSIVLHIKRDHDRVPTAAGRRVKVDMVAVDEARGLRLVLEFDGAYWHGKKASRKRDTVKACRLRDAGWTVVRVREDPLDKLDPRFDVVVPFQADPDSAAKVVLSHLADLGIISPAEAAAYQPVDGPLASDLAKQWIRDRQGEKALGVERRSHQDGWSQMCAALVVFEAKHGHCRVPEGVQINGVSLAAWVRKQRTIHRKGQLANGRVAHLRKIPSWSFTSSYEAGFCGGYRRYAAWAASRDQAAEPTGEQLGSRAATVWATNLRRRRQALQAAGKDLPAEQLQAMADIPGWQWDPFEDEFQTKLAVLYDFIAQTGGTIADIKQRDRWHDHRIGSWINVWRTRRDQLTQEHLRILDALPGWTSDKHVEAWEANFAALQRFSAVHGHTSPSLTGTSEHEKALARWKRNNKNRLQGRTCENAQRFRWLLAEYGEQMP